MYEKKKQIIHHTSNMHESTQRSMLMILIHAHARAHVCVCVCLHVFSMLNNYYVLYAFHCFPIKDYVGVGVDVFDYINHHSRLMLPYHRYIPHAQANTHTDTYLYTFISISACFV